MEIEQLKAEIAELKEENAKLRIKAKYMKEFRRVCKRASRFCSHLKKSHNKNISEQAIELKNQYFDVIHRMNAES